MAGLTASGLVVKILDDVIEELDEDLAADFGSSVDLTDDSVLGRIRSIFAAAIAEAWEVLEAVYNSTDPDNASGDALDKLCALTGTTREPASSSETTLTATGTAATVIPALSRASVDDTGELFENADPGTLAAATAWGAATAYVVDDIVTNSSRIYVCTVAGTSAGSGGPTGTTTGETDNTVTWDYVGEGTAYAQIEFTSVNTGPIVANSRDITTIETPVSGWDSVINLLDATLGTNQESDEDLRVRREDELTSGANSPVDAIRADLLLLDDVTAVTVFQNNTDVTDGDGLPPHSVEALVQGGLDQDIFDQLLASVAAGIATYGTEAGTAEDSQGNSHDINFTRPSEINIYVTLTLTYDEDLYPADGDDQIAEAIVAFGGAQKTGKDVVSSAMKAQAFSVAGVLDVSLAYIGTSASPSSETTIAIALRELAVFDTSRIIVNSSAATP